MDHIYGGKESRQLYRALMRREILFFALLHDIRGSLTSLMGWHSMLEEDAGLPWSSMGRSIDGLRQSSVDFTATNQSEGTVTRVSIGAALCDFSSSSTVNWDVIGNGFVLVDLTRLLSALELAAPDRIEVCTVDGRVLLKLQGLPGRGVKCLESQTSKELIALSEIEGRDWGVVLLKETVRTVSGSTISVTGANSVTISLRSEV